MTKGVDVCLDVKEELNEIVEQVRREGISPALEVLDIDYLDNQEILKRYINILEERVGGVINPLLAIPLIAINGDPILVGIGPGFKKIIKEAIEKKQKENDTTSTKT